MQMPFNIFQRVSQAPTNPKEAPRTRHFDVADLYRGPLQSDFDAENTTVALDEKLRQAYFWIVNSAIISPHYDIEFNDTPPQSFRVGDSKRRLTLPYLPRRVIRVTCSCHCLHSPHDESVCL